jgi:uncharacterized protein (DUF433 family)
VDSAPAEREGNLRTPQIICDSNILCGKPVIAGTRISVELIMEELGAGTSVEDLLTDYPHLTREDVLAAIEFAAHSSTSARSE